MNVITKNDKEVKEGAQPEEQPKKKRRQYVNFAFYKIDQAWRLQPEAEKEKDRQEFEQVIEAFQDRVKVIGYTTIGIRAETDMILWRISWDLDNFQEMTTRMLQTNLGRHMDTPYSYLSMTKRSVYVDKHVHEGQEGRRLELIPGQSRYIFIYPFVKTREWYLLPVEKRQEMMNDHIRIGHKYPSVKLNTTYAFGLDDQEFVVAFESDQPDDFLDLVMELRESPGSRFTLRDTPIFTGLRRKMPELLKTIG